MGVFNAFSPGLKPGTMINYPFMFMPPEGFLRCDGSAVSRTLYADLFAVIGTTYGAGDGSTTFNLPFLVNKYYNAYAATYGNSDSGFNRLQIYSANSGFRELSFNYFGLANIISYSGGQLLEGPLWIPTKDAIVGAGIGPQYATYLDEAIYIHTSPIIKY